jgi:hypothetical protein
MEDPMKIRSLLSATAALALLAGCAPAHLNWSEPRTAAATSSVITPEEIVTAGASNLYDVVLRLRPGWLTGRGMRNFDGVTGNVVVYQDEVRLGDVSTLRDLGLEYVVSLRYMDASSAAALPGIRPREIPGGAIVVTTPARAGD